MAINRVKKEELEKLTSRLIIKMLNDLNFEDSAKQYYHLVNQQCRNLLNFSYQLKKDQKSNELTLYRRVFSREKTMFSKQLDLVCSEGLISTFCEEKKLGDKKAFIIKN